MVTNVLKALLVLFVFLVVMKNSERQFAIAKSVQNVEVGLPSIRDLQEAEDRRCQGWYQSCILSSQCCQPGKCRMNWKQFQTFW